MQSAPLSLIARRNLSKPQPAKERDQDRSVALHTTFQSIGSDLDPLSPLEIRDSLAEFIGVKLVVGEEIEIDGRSVPNSQSKRGSTVEGEGFGRRIEFRPQIELSRRKDG